MSYEKVKYVSFNKKRGEINITSACNNCVPLTYEKWNYMEAHKECSFEEGVVLFWINVLNGNFHINGPEKMKHIASDAELIYDTTCADVDVLSMDFKYKTSFSNELAKVVAEEFAMPMSLEKVSDYSKLNAFRKTFLGRCKATWEEKDEQDRKNGIVRIRAAVRTNVFPEYDALYCEDTDETIVARCDKYSGGILDDSSKTAIRLGNGSGNLWHFIGYSHDLEDVLKQVPQLKAIA